MPWFSIVLLTDNDGKPSTKKTTVLCFLSKNNGNYTQGQYTFIQMLFCPD